MIDRIVVVDSGQVIETTESAIIAKDEADRAEKWAKYSEEQANLASNNAIAAAASKEAAAKSAQSAANTVNGFDAHAAQKQTDFDNNATSKLNSFNTNASKKQAQVDASADLAESWAIGNTTDRPQGSAKYWAEQAKTSTAGTLNESILTNCLTKIPQDIKLELADGTLTLKAGSKVYVPNGVGVFNPVTIDRDIAITQIWGDPNSKLLIFYKPADNSLERISVERSHSGTTDSGSGSGNHIFYDTTINKINWIKRSGSVDAQLSIPIASVTAVGNNTSTITSIDQVFDGFGYIGSTIFVLPGVEGLIPNGRNTDGSLNNLKYTINNLLTVQAGTTSNGYFGIVNGSLLRRYPANAVYDEAKNIWYNPETGNSFQFLYFGNFSEVSSRITSLTPNTAFHAVDYNEFAREVGRCAKIDENGVINYRGDRTLALSDNSRNVPDTKWINSKFQKVSTLPAQPDPNVTYLIPEE